MDKEELRMDKAVKVTRKELNNLVAELIEFEDMYSKQLIETPKKRKPPDISCSALSNASRVNHFLFPSVSENTQCQCNSIYYYYCSDN